jgi:hypothetical protein
MDKFEQHIKRMKGLRDVYEAGTGQHNILSMLITECEAALRLSAVISSVCDIQKGTRCDKSFPSYTDGKCRECGGQAN